MNKNFELLWDKLYLLIEEASSITLSTHVNPDGDGLGSEIAFYYYLKNIGKEVRIINSSPIPDKYKIIDPHEVIEQYNVSQNEWLQSADLSIIFDIGDYKRLVEVFDQIKNTKLIVIDHHPQSDLTFYDLTIIDTISPATGYMVWKYLRHIENKSTVAFSIEICKALYASLITDTGSFRYASTHPDAHFMAAHLLENGVKPYDIHREIYEQRPLSQVKLLSLIIDELKFSDDMKIAWYTITQNMLSKSNTSIIDVDGYTEFVRSIKNVEVAFMLLELEDGGYRINFRSSGNYKINDIANYFGGGGHEFAAGASIIKNTFSNAEEEILKKVKQKIYGDFVNDH